MGGLVAAAIGVVLLVLAYKGPNAWLAAWNALVTK